MASSLALSKIIKEYLDPEMTHSIFFDENSTFNVDTDPDLLSEIRAIRVGVTLLMEDNILPTLFDCPPIHSNDKNSGVAGQYISFESKNMRKGFVNLIENFKILRPVRKSKVLTDDFPMNAIANVGRDGKSYGPSCNLGVKIQVLPSTKDKYHEAKCIREERILERLNESSFAPYVPKLYFGCTLILPLNLMVLSKHYTVSVRLTFLEHLGGYENLRTYFTRQASYRRFIRNETIDAIKDILSKLWKNGVSHNDFAAQNLMISLHSDTDVKLLDFGLATMVDFSRLRRNMTWEEIRREYVEYYANVKNSFDNDGSNVKKMNELLDVITHINREAR